MPPTAMIFWMNGGNGAAVKLSPVVLSSITPVSRFTATSSPSRMAFAAAGHSMIGRPISMELR